jgi:SWI/SNF-related matrix-associated actin-dependent regulator 1 of chromatin subfamily A
MCNSFYLRREKEQVLKELPDKTRSTILFDINNRSEYDRAYNDIRQYIYETKEKKISAYAEALIKIETLKQLIAKGKLEQSIEWIENFIEQEKLVLFVHHKEIVKDLKEYFPEALTITGDDDIVAKDQAVQEFQNNNNAKLIICSIKSASVGLTLTASSNVAFLELAWTPADHDQAEDRCHRIGQKNHVNIYYLLANNTIEDQMIMPLIEKKRNIFNQVVRGVEVSGNGDLLRDLIEMF